MLIFWLLFRSVLDLVQERSLVCFQDSPWDENKGSQVDNDLPTEVCDGNQKEQKHGGCRVV